LQLLVAFGTESAELEIGQKWAIRVRLARSGRRLSAPERGARS
jgi:hypothetical protein